MEQPELEFTITVEVITWRYILCKYLINIGVRLINFGISTIDVRVVK